MSFSDQTLLTVMVTSKGCGFSAEFLECLMQRVSKSFTNSGVLPFLFFEFPVTLPRQK